MRRFGPLFFRCALLGSALVPLSSGPQAIRAVSELRFQDAGYTYHGTWLTSGSIRPARWTPRAGVSVDVSLRIDDAHIQAIADAAKIVADGFCLLITAERTFDAEGWLRQANDEKMSTLVTPTGLGIEGGIQGAATNRFGYRFRTPIGRVPDASR